MSASVDIDVRQRFGGTKVRSGCVTCKKRRVKCGEEKPSCERCLKAGRICEGYTPSGNGRRNPDGSLIMIIYGPPPSNSPSPVPSASSQERRSFDFFRARTANQFAGPFPSELWAELLPQLSHQEDAIKHAMVAIGSLHEAVEQGVTANTEYAMRQYGKAINQVLTLDISKTDSAADTAVITCLLFTAFETMQGHYKSAMTHSSAGLKILREQEERHRKEAYIGRHAMKAAFMQLDTQAREIGEVSMRPLPSLPWRTKPPVGPFETLLQAKNWLEEYLRDLTQFLTTFGADWQADPDGPQSVLEEHGEKTKLFEAWCIACRPLDIKYGALLHGTPTHAAQGYLIIQIWKVMIHMVLNLDFQLAEMGWDTCDADFSRIVSIGEQFVRNSLILDGSVGHACGTQFAGCKPVISFSIGIIVPLFMTASRCRNPQTRRSAWELLKACNRSESMWNATLAAQLVGRIIELEETGLGHINLPADVPLESRILGLDITFSPDRQGKITWFYQNPSFVGNYSNGPRPVGEDISWSQLPIFSNISSVQTGRSGSEQTTPNPE